MHFSELQNCAPRSLIPPVRLPLIKQISGERSEKEKLLCDPRVPYTRLGLLGPTHVNRIGDGFHRQASVK